MLLGWAVFRAGQFVAALPAPVIFFFAGLWYAVWHFVRRPFPALDENPLLDLMNYHTPTFYGWVLLWYYVSPFVVVMLSGLIVLTIWKVWLEGRRRDFAPFAKLPPWPLDPKQKTPAIVIGEVHHPVEAREIFSPSWLTIPERGLYTGVAIFGAVGSGKTSACMNPFARQILGWQAANPQMRAAALVLEGKGDFCHDIHQILDEAGREKDYIELGMNARWQWNPLSAWWLDSYSLAYTVSSLLNQLFGKGKEPFWQQAYTNLVRWIIELHRVFPGALGDVATGLPLCHRPGAFRGQDRGSREAERRPEHRDGFRTKEGTPSPTHKPCRMGLDAHAASDGRFASARLCLGANQGCRSKEA